MGSQADIGGVRAEQIAAFLAGTRPITNYWHNKYRALFGFYSFAKSRGHVTEVPLPAKPPKQLPPFVPYIYSREELRRLLDAAGCYQRGESALDPVTFRTILLLLYGTGLRDGEVIRLNRADVDLDNSLLTVRLTKFHKSRLVPFGPQVCQILTEYANSRTAPVVRPGEETPFFTTRKGTRIVLNTLQAHFRRSSCAVGHPANRRRTLPAALARSAPHVRRPSPDILVSAGGGRAEPGFPVVGLPGTRPLGRYAGLPQHDA